MMTWFKKLPWWFWVGLIILALFLWQNFTGWAYSSKLYNLVKKEMVADMETIIEELEQDNLQNQKEKETLYRQIEQLSKQKAELQKEKDTLKAKIEEIIHAQENIVIPDDPGELVLLLRKLGFRSIERRKVQ